MVVVVVVVVVVATRVFRIPPFLKIDGLFEDMDLMIEEFLANKKEQFKNCQTNSFWKQPDLVGIGEQWKNPGCLGYIGDYTAQPAMWGSQQTMSYKDPY